MATRDRSPRRNSRQAPAEKRVFLSNIPFEMKWQEVKDLFKEQVGAVSYVNLFKDEQGQSRGCGILEFESSDNAKRAVEKMHRYEFKGRKLVVKEDFDVERDQYGRIITDKNRSSGPPGRPGQDRRGGGGGGGGGGGNRNDGGGQRMMMMGAPRGNTYGLSVGFLESLGIDGPLNSRLFVANLSYDVDEKKLREVFGLAGRVCMVQLNKDKEGKSRGHGIIEYTHPVEAVQAISMLHDHKLFDRKLIVRFDQVMGPTPEQLDQLPSRLPEGLESVGMGLGAGGNPLTNVAQNLPNQSSGGSGGGGGGGGNMMGDMGNLASAMGSLTEMAQLARTMGMGNMGGGGAGGGNMGSGMGNMGGGGGMGGGSGMGNMGGSMGSGGGGAGSAMGPMGGMGSMGGGGGAGMNNMGGGGTGMGSMGIGAGGSAMMRGGATNSGAGGTTSGGSGMTSSDTVIVRNLPPECNWQALRQGFSHCGEIKYAEMKDRGTGLVRFTNERDAELAMSMMDKHSIGGRTIDVRLY